jgi:hypothetical protein
LRNRLPAKHPQIVKVCNNLQRALRP